MTYDLWYWPGIPDRASDRRPPFGDGIFRYYPELDAA